MFRIINSLYKKYFNLSKIIKIILLIFIVYVVCFVTINNSKIKELEIKNKSDTESEIKDIYSTHLHTLELKKFPNDFFHIGIYEEDGNNFELIAINGGTTFGKSFFKKLEIFKVKINLDNNDYQEEIIYEIENNYRPLDVLITDKKNILISHVEKDQNGFFKLSIKEIIKLNNSYVHEEIFSSKAIPPPTLTAEAGGKMIQLETNKILIGIGDFERSDLIDEPNYQHSKFFTVNIKTKQYDLFASGTRNPQGLYYHSKKNKIIATEHGPYGGDEINIIEKNNHYGWPMVSYGMPYKMDNRQIFLGDHGGAKFGRHEKYTKPLYSLIPSIGIKSIEKFNIVNFEFPLWNDQFIFCSGRGTYRAIFDNNITRLILKEKILDKGCRDLAILKNGKIIQNDMTIITRDKKTYPDRN
jgi:hypothetical protein